MLGRLVYNPGNLWDNSLVRCEDFVKAGRVDISFEHIRRLVAVDSVW